MCEKILLNKDYLSLWWQYTDAETDTGSES